MTRLPERDSRVRLSAGAAPISTHVPARDIQASCLFARIGALVAARDVCPPELGRLPRPDRDVRLWVVPGARFSV